MKTIYILCSCNDWKEYDGMRLVAATTSLYKLKNIIIRKIKDEDMEYKKGDENLSIQGQIKQLKTDWEERGHDFVFDNLGFGYVETVADGEIQ